MNKKQRKAKLKRAQHHQLQGKNPELKRIPEPQKPLYYDRSPSSSKRTPDQGEVIRLMVGRNRKSVSYWWRLMLVKIALTGISLKGFLFPRSR